MREIKFRAWLFKRKMMVDLDSLIFLGPNRFGIGFTNAQKTGLYEEDMEKDDYVYLNLNNSPEPFEVMQYTGANDKRGVEIYEGDIVKFESSVPIPEDPDYPKEGQIGVVKYGFCDYYVDAKSLCGFNLDELGDWIVIGNIYENPEILKDTK